MKQPMWCITSWFCWNVDEFAAELNTRMTTEEIEERGGVVLLKPEFVNRGNHVEK